MDKMIFTLIRKSADSVTIRNKITAILTANSDWLTEPFELTVVAQLVSYHLDDNTRPLYCQGMLRQYIAELYPDRFGYYYRNFYQKEIKSGMARRQFERLREIPVIEQRSPLWYQIRKNHLGGSEGSAALGMNPYKSEVELLREKSGHSDKKFTGSKFTEHGVLGEDAVAMMCQYIRSVNDDTPREDAVIAYFGFIESDRTPFLSASPDGICPDGTMLEIKCPLARVCEPGAVPEYYWVQVQHQLYVCDLYEAKYIEAGIQVFSDENDMLFSLSQGKNAIYDDINDAELVHPTTGEVYGAVIRYIPHGSLPEGVSKKNCWGNYKYIHAKHLLSSHEKGQTPQLKHLRENIALLFDQHKDILNINDEGTDVLYYKITYYHETPVLRDDVWFHTALPKYRSFWNKVLDSRKNGLPDSAKPRARKTKVAPGHGKKTTANPASRSSKESVTADGIEPDDDTDDSKESRLQRLMNSDF